MITSGVFVGDGLVDVANWGWVDGPWRIRIDDILVLHEGSCEGLLFSSLVSFGDDDEGDKRSQRNRGHHPLGNDQSLAIIVFLESSVHGAGVIVASTRVRTAVASAAVCVPVLKAKVVVASSAKGIANALGTLTCVYSSND
jgi:hypothetical protein